MRLSKLIGLVLAGGCVLLLAFSGLLVSGMLTTMETTEEVDALPLNNEDQNLIAALDESGLDGYGVISQKPLFNESRIPDPTAGQEVDGDDDKGDDPEVPIAEPLDVSVNGIIITPDLRLAIVTDNKTNTRMRVREGMPLEEEMAAWRLDSIEPRKLTFSDGDSKESIVEMAVDSEGAPPPAPTARPAERNEENGGDGNDNSEPDATRAEQAEEIRRRVAERRAQLRAEAERRRAEQNKEQ